MLDDRFTGCLGYRDVGWPRKGQATRPRANGRHGRRNIAFAVLTSFAAVAILAASAFYLVVSDESDGNGAAAGDNESRAGWQGPPPTLSPADVPTTFPTTPRPQTPGTSLAPPSITTSAMLFLWNPRIERWQYEMLALDASDYTEGDTIPFLLKIRNAEPGKVYELAIHYFNCGLSPGQSFDGLASTQSSGDLPRLEAPGPGRVRPDSQVQVPSLATADHSGATPYLAVWGGAIQQAPVQSDVISNCSGDRSLNVQILAHGPTLYAEWGGHLAAKTTWLGGGAAHAGGAFRMMAILDGKAKARIEVLPNTTAR